MDTIQAIDEFSQEEGKDLVRYNTVYGLHCCLKHIVQKAKKHKTDPGDSNPE